MRQSTAPLSLAMSAASPKLWLALDVSIIRTFDANRPVSTATQSALDAKVDNTITYTKTDVDPKVSNLIASTPGGLHTLNELPQALGNNPKYATTCLNLVATASNVDNV